MRNPGGYGILRTQLSERSSAWLEHLVWDQDVAGSNPVAPTIFLSNKTQHRGDTQGEAAVQITGNYQFEFGLLFGRDFCQRELFLAVGFFNLAGGGDFLGVLAHFFVEGLGDVVLLHIIGDGFAIFFGLDDGLAFVAFVQAAFGALGLTLDGDLFAFTVTF